MAQVKGFEAERRKYEVLMCSNMLIYVLNFNFVSYAENPIITLFLSKRQKLRS